MKNILVTGGYGFIGHNVVRSLLPKYNVTVIDNVTDYGILDRFELHRLFAERVSVIEQVGKVHGIFGDINNNAVLNKGFNTNPQVVIHLASFPRAKVVNNNPIAGSEVMSTSLLRLLLKCKEYNVQRFVYVSSSMVYGNFESGVTEDSICEPFGLYAIMKYAGELLVKDFCKANNIDYVIVRPSAVYGPRDVEDRVVSKFFVNAIKNNDIIIKGENEILDFSFVTDVARYIALSALVPLAANKTYNVTCGEGATLLQAAQMIINITGSTSRLVIKGKDNDFPSRGVLSNTKAITDLDYSPKVSIQTGFEYYNEWLKKNSVFWS
jgi:nucleoside-diphosphate-sugar epimerase